jgi:hypothetical protein
MSAARMGERRPTLAVTVTEEYPPCPVPAPPVPVLARMIPLGLCAALTFGAVACSSKDDSSSSADKNETTTTADTGSQGSDTSKPGTDGTSSAEGDASAVKLADGEATPRAHDHLRRRRDDEHHRLVQPGGVDRARRREGHDSGTHAIRFGSSTDTYTITGGLIETFTISEPGTYTVTEDISGTTMTLTVT